MRHTANRLTFSPERDWSDDPAVASDAVNRIAVLGDVHNRDWVVEQALLLAVREGCDALVQVGDFWLQDSSWPFWHLSAQFGSVPVAVSSPLPVIVMDGNHEVWPCLRRYMARGDVPDSPNVPQHLSGSLWWATRGSVWDWAGVRFGALGGAVSPDRHISRVAGHRWDDEAPTEEDLHRLLANAGGGLDVLFTHDAPAGVRGLVSGLGYKMPADLQTASTQVSRLLRRAAQETGARLLVHGHWHQHNNSSILAGACEVIGLAADGTRGSVAIVDLDPLLVRVPGRVAAAASPLR